jgi:hypothetical protein
VSKLPVLIVFLFVSNAWAARSYICENTRAFNGRFNEDRREYHVRLFKAKRFNEFYSYVKGGADQLNPHIYVKNNKFFWDDGKSKYFINMSRIIKELERGLSHKLSPWLKFGLNKKSNVMTLSPFLTAYDKSGAQLPQWSVFYKSKEIPYFENQGTVFNFEYIKYGNYYHEFDVNMGMFSELSRQVKSAYQKDSLNCLREKNGVVIEDYSIKPSEFEDVTFNLKKWHPNFKDLRDSIQLVVYNDAINSKKLDTLQNIGRLSFLSYEMNLEQMVQWSSARIARLKQDAYKFVEMTQKNTSSSKMRPHVQRLITNEKEGTEIITVPLDITDEADDRKAYNVNDTIDPYILTHVTLTKIGPRQYFFYFHNNRRMDHQLRVGPIDFEKIYWKQFTRDINVCTKKIYRNLNEYERKAFVFEKLKRNNLTPEEIVVLENLRRYMLEEFVLTNNCRGTGSFEYEWPGMVKGYFQLPLKIMDEIYEELTGSKVGWLENGVEIRYTKFYYDYFKRKKLLPEPNRLLDKLLSFWSRNQEDEYRWINFNNFDKVTNLCTADDVVSDLVDEKLDFKSVKFDYATGRIPYRQLTGETKKKALYRGNSESLSYIKTPCSKNKTKPPLNFQSPLQIKDMTPTAWWQSGPCVWAPHRFDYYENILKYDVALSKFEIDGVYSGKNTHAARPKLSDRNKAKFTDERVRMPFDFTNAYSFKNLEVAKKNGRIYIKLSSGNDFNFIIGNVPEERLEKLENRNRLVSYTKFFLQDDNTGLYSLVGINPMPLASFYEAEWESDGPAIFSFFYDDNKRILNHHETHIGIEQWLLRKNGDNYILDIISHERILPVARVTFTLR